MSAAVAAEEGQSTQPLLRLDDAAAPSEGFHRDELDFRAKASGRQRAGNRAREDTFSQVGAEDGTGQRTHAAAPTTSAKSASGSVLQMSIRSPADSNSSPILARLCLQLISVRSVSACANGTRPIPGILTSCSTVDTRCISMRWVTIS